MILKVMVYEKSLRLGKQWNWNTPPFCIRIKLVFGQFYPKNAGAPRFFVFGQLQIEMGIERFCNSFLYVLFFVVVNYGFQSRVASNYGTFAYGSSTDVLPGPDPQSSCRASPLCNIKGVVT